MHEAVTYWRERERERERDEREADRQSLFSYQSKFKLR